MLSFLHKTLPDERCVAEGRVTEKTGLLHGAWCSPNNSKQTKLNSGEAQGNRSHQRKRACAPLPASAAFWTLKVKGAAKRTARLTGEVSPGVLHGEWALPQLAMARAECTRDDIRAGWSHPGS